MQLFSPCVVLGRLILAYLAGPPLGRILKEFHLGFSNEKELHFVTSPYNLTLSQGKGHRKAASAKIFRRDHSQEQRGSERCWY